MNITKKASVLERENNCFSNRWTKSLEVADLSYVLTR